MSVVRCVIGIARIFAVGRGEVGRGSGVHSYTVSVSFIVRFGVLNGLGKAGAPSRKCFRLKFHILVNFNAKLLSFITPLRQHTIIHGR